MQAGVSPDGSAAGTVVDQAVFLLDGGNNSNDMDGSSGVYNPSFGDDPSAGLVLAMRIIRSAAPAPGSTVASPRV